MENLIWVALGWIGTIGTFSAYLLIWRGAVDSTAKVYTLLNAAGGFMSAIGAFAYQAWPAFVSSFVWGLIGAIGLFATMRGQRREAREETAAVENTAAQSDAVEVNHAALEVASTALEQSHTSVEVDHAALEGLELLLRESTLRESVIDRAGVQSNADIAGFSTELLAELPLEAFTAWNPNQTEASVIELPWLARAHEEEIVLSLDQVPAQAGVEFVEGLDAAENLEIAASREFLMTESLTMPNPIVHPNPTGLPTQTLPIAC